jgi:16S rRNA (adenine1518-N6/adenine1519-N6)-dimethyltransferase
MRWRAATRRPARRAARLPEPAVALPPLRDVIARHGIGARKALGQHFLFDMNLTRRIARAPGDLAGCTVVEVGPGPGGLTRALLETDAARVIAIERDARCLDALAELSAAFPGRLEVIEGDALEIDAAEVGGADGGARHIIANLPYNIGTPLLIGWLRRADRFAAMTLMFQKEVAQRLCAPPGADAYGRLAVLTQWLCEARIAFDVPARAFVPPPRVTSAVALLHPREIPLAPARMEVLERVTQAAFGQRRKMLRSSLKSLGDTAGLLETAGIDPTARAEQLTVEQFCALARAVDG